MIDRERLLADDHQARLHAEAQHRRLAAEAAVRPADQGPSSTARLRLSVGHWLVRTGHRLDTSVDPGTSAAPKPA